MWVPAEDALLGAVSDSSEGDPWLTHQGKPVALYTDTGAEVTILTEQVWKRVGQLSWNPQTEHCVAQTLMSYPLLGSSLVPSRWGTEQPTPTSMLRNGNDSPSLSLDDLQLFSIFNSSSESQPSTTRHSSLRRMSSHHSSKN